MVNPSSYRLCLVHWSDAHGIKTEGNRDEVLLVHKPAEYWTIGTLVKSDEAGVTVAQDLGLPLTQDFEMTYRNRTFIPRNIVIDEFDVGPVIRRKRVAKPPKTEDA